MLLGIIACGQFKSNSYLENSNKVGLLATTDFTAKNRYGIGISYATYKNAFHYIGDLRGSAYETSKEKYKSISVSYGIGIRALTLGNSVNGNLTLSPFVGYEKKESLISVGKSLEFFKAGGFIRGELEVNIYKLNTLSIGGEQEFGYYYSVTDYIYRRSLYVALRFSM